MTDTALMKQITKHEAQILEFLKSGSYKAAAEILRNSVIYQGQTVAELKRPDDSMIYDLDDIENTDFLKIENFLNELTDDDEQKAAGDIYEAGKQIYRETKENGRGVDIITAAFFIPLVLFYTSTGQKTTNHLFYVSNKTFKTVTKELEKRKKEKEETNKNFILDRERIIKDVVSHPWIDDKGFTERLIRQMGKRKDEIYTMIYKGLIRGERYEQIAQDIADRMTKIPVKDAYKLVYTEGTHAFNETTAQAAAAFGYSEYIFESVGDGRVCGDCRGLDGQIFHLAEREPGVNFPPIHTSCRCSIEVV